ncbi:hypothetical protein WMY93_008988 [Mugilogobius chulae]|uniref:Uncharacterized protein n=1 Tax=Mugilogobius chulae TaxID=88201 RepID=A0AAW0PBI1_9GOBI
MVDLASGPGTEDAVEEDGHVLITEMSQAHNSRDNQALLQSMLQRLRLQPGTTNIQSEPNTTGGQNVHSETLDSQAFNNNCVNGFEPTKHNKSDFTVTGNLQDLDSSIEGSGATGQSQKHRHVSQSEQQFSPTSAYAASPPSSEGFFQFSNSETKDISSGQSLGQKQDQDSGFVPKVYAWSMQNTALQNDKMSFEGVFGATSQNTEIITNNQNSTNNRKQQSSENKTRKWTQKIKDKWRERPSSFGKKYRFVDKTTTQENSPQYKPHRTDHLKIQTTNGNDECMRSTNDFDLGLGSFSLLDEIVSGQEWAKFLNPAMRSSIHEEATQETMDQTLINYYDKKSTINSVLSKDNVESNTHIFEKSEEASNIDINMTQMSPEAPLHVSMNITDKTQMQSEPMDHGQSQSDMQVADSSEQPQYPHTTKIEFTNTVDNSSLRGSRKRQHQTYENTGAKLQRIEKIWDVTVDDGSVFLPDNHPMDDMDGRLTSLFPSATKPCSPVPRGVLKKTFSCDSTNSVETVTKKRRMDVNRHVRFSERLSRLSLQS